MHYLLRSMQMSVFAMSLSCGRYSSQQPDDGQSRIALSPAAGDSILNLSLDRALTAVRQRPGDTVPIYLNPFTRPLQAGRPHPASWVAAVLGQRRVDATCPYDHAGVCTGKERAYYIILSQPYAAAADSFHVDIVVYFIDPSQAGTMAGSHAEQWSAYFARRDGVIRLAGESLRLLSN